MKPVLFAHLPILTTMQPSSAVPVKCDWCPPATNNVALVLDLPGIQGVFVALALAERGYRPVPLYNSLPAPVSAEAAVDVDPMLSALQHQASRLLELRVPLRRHPPLCSTPIARATPKGLRNHSMFPSRAGTVPCSSAP